MRHRQSAVGHSEALPGDGFEVPLLRPMEGHARPCHVEGPQSAEPAVPRHEAPHVLRPEHAACQAFETEWTPELDEDTRYIRYITFHNISLKLQSSIYIGFIRL